MENSPPGIQAIPSGVFANFSGAAFAITPRASALAKIDKVRPRRITKY
jgi:hypothetical protein